jgi:predicted permease
VRALAARPGFAAATVAVLALGIGANTSIYSVVHSVLIRPLPYPDAGRLVFVWNRYEQYGLLDATAAVPDYFDRREQNRVFEQVAAYHNSPVHYTGGGEPLRLPACRVTASLFPLFRVDAAHGRTFLDEEEQPGHEQVAVLTHALWKRLFAADETLLGRDITLNGRPHTVVGILPPHFMLPDQSAEIFLPLAFMPEQRTDDARGNEFLTFLGRMKPGVTLAQVRDDMERIARGVRERFPEYYPDSLGWGTTVVPLREQIAGRVRPGLLVLSAAAGFVLLIACANVANLMLVRASGRGREVAVRLALGAGRLRIARHVLTECALLALAGGAVGLVLALWGADLLVSLEPGSLPALTAVRIDGSVLLFTLAASVLTGLIFGLAPAWRASRIELVSSLKEGGPGHTSGPGRNRLRSTLVVSEIALALILLIGAGLLIRSLLRLQTVDPGFRAQGVLSAQITLTSNRYTEKWAQAAFVRDLLAEVNAVPGVESAGAVSELPMAGSNSTASFQVEGRQNSAADSDSLSAFKAASPGYFRAMGIPVLRGRDFSDADGVDAPRAVVVDKRLAERYWPGQDPIGKRLKMTFDGLEAPWRNVVGVVGEVKHYGLNASSYPHIYIPYAQMPVPYVCLVARMGADPAALTAALREKVRGLDPELPLYNLRMMEEYVSGSLARPRFTALLLGARRADVLKLVLVQSARLGLAGMGIGLAGAVALTRLLGSFLFGVSPLDPVTYGGVSALFLSVALLASYLPARRALRLDPAVALRCE